MTNINLDQFLGGSYIGAQGIQGIAGSQGIQGRQGIQGSLGSQGIQGITGSQGIVGALKPWTIITANHLAVNGDRLIANTTAGSFTVTLPDGPTTGSYLQITDGGNWSVNNLLIDRNGTTIEGIADTLILDVPQTTVEFIYDGTTWQFTSTTGARGPTGITGSQGIQGTNGAPVIAITDDITSITTRYVSFVDAISGTVTGLGVSSTKLYFNPNTGTLNATEFNSLSDMSLKENIETITNPLESIKNINGFKFNWKDTKEKSMGVSAQNIEDIFPEIVNNDIHKSVNYNGLIAVLIEAIKQLDDKIEALTKK